MSFKLPVVLSDLVSKLTRRPQRPPAELQVVSSLMLSPREKVWVVEVGDSWFVLGSGANGLTTLGQTHKGGLPLTLRPGDMPFDLEQLLSSAEKPVQLHGAPESLSGKAAQLSAATSVEATAMDAPAPAPSVHSEQPYEPACSAREAAAEEVFGSAATADLSLDLAVYPIQAEFVQEEPAPAAPASGSEAAADAFPAVADVAAEAQQQIAGAVTPESTPVVVADKPKVETAEELAQKFIGIRAEAERIDAVQTVGADEHGFPDPALAVEVTVNEAVKKPADAATEATPVVPPTASAASGFGRPMSRPSVAAKSAPAITVKPAANPVRPVEQSPTKPTHASENALPKEDASQATDKKPSFMALYAEVKNGTEGKNVSH